MSHFSWRLIVWHKKWLFLIFHCWFWFWCFQLKAWLVRFQLKAWLIRPTMLTCSGTNASHRGRNMMSVCWSYSGHPLSVTHRWVIISSECMAYGLIWIQSLFFVLYQMAASRSRYVHFPCWGWLLKACKNEDKILKDYLWKWLTI